MTSNHNEQSTAPLGSEEDVIPLDAASQCGLYDGANPRAIEAAKVARLRVRSSLKGKKHALQGRVIQAELQLLDVKKELLDFEREEQIMILNTEVEAITAVEDEEAGLIPPASTTTVLPTSTPSRPPPGLPAPPVTTISAVHAMDTVGSITDMDGTDRIPDKAVEAVEAGLISSASTTAALSTAAPSRPPPDLPAPPVAAISAVHTTDTVGSTTDMDSLDRDSVMFASSDMDIGATDNTWALACAVCNGKHVATKCRTLCRLGPKDRIKKVRSLHLCFSCLKPGHDSYRFQERLRCKVQWCQRHHATLLHGSTWPSSTTSMDTSGAGQSHTRIVQAGASQDTGTPPPSSPAVHSQGSEAQGQGVMYSGHVVESAVQKVALPIVAMKVKAPGSDSCVDTYALLDTGSSRSFCTEGLFNALGIEGRTKPVAVSTLTGYTYDHATRIADLQVSDICGKESLLLSNVHARTVLPELMGHMGTEVDADRWPHLHGWPIPQA